VSPHIQQQAVVNCTYKRYFWDLEYVPSSLDVVSIDINDSLDLLMVAIPTRMHLAYFQKSKNSKGLYRNFIVRKHLLQCLSLIYMEKEVHCELMRLSVFQDTGSQQLY